MTILKWRYKTEIYLNFKCWFLASYAIFFGKKWRTWLVERAESFDIHLRYKRQLWTRWDSPFNSRWFKGDCESFRFVNQEEIAILTARHEYWVYAAPYRLKPVAAVCLCVEGDETTFIVGVKSKYSWRREQRKRVISKFYCICYRDISLVINLCLLTCITVRRRYRYLLVLITSYLNNVKVATTLPDPNWDTIFVPSLLLPIY